MISQLIHYLEWLRHLASSNLAGVNPDSAALVLGLSIGDDSLLSSSLRQSMRLTSLTHLTAVSGANCAIVIGAVYFLLSGFAIKFRVLFALAALGGYVLLVGAQPSVLRASAMSTAVMLALAFGRKIQPLAALLISATLLELFNPSLIFEYGFVLSVLATAGILIVSPKLYQLWTTQLPKPLAMGLSVSSGAQLFCFPVLLGLQPGIATYWLPANLIAEPLIAPITVIGLLAVLLAWVPPISTTLFWLASLFAWPIEQVARYFSSLPFATMPWSPGWLGVIAAVILVCAILCVLFAKSLTLRTIAAITAVVLFCCSLGVVVNQVVRISIWPTPNWQVVSCDVGQGDATVVRSGGAIAVIDVGRDDKKIDNCLSRLGVKNIQLLVITHFDADHSAGLGGALAGREVKAALLTSFVDERPGADFARLLLEKRGIAISTSEIDLHGKLGDVQWRVLSPSKTGEEAEDSNDGSIVMNWQFRDFVLLTMADLGEKGQMRLAERFDSWHTNLPVVLKVAHHGSADQFPELIEALAPKVALISVGKDNGYGHPTRRTLQILAEAYAQVLRTDQLGSIAIVRHGETFEMSYSGAS